MNTVPAMSNRPIKGGVILEKRVRNDRALPRTLIKAYRCKKTAKNEKTKNANKMEEKNAQKNVHLLLRRQPLYKTAKTTCSSCSAAVVSMAENICFNLSVLW